MFSNIAWSGCTSLLPKHHNLDVFLRMPLIQEVFVKLPKAQFGRYTFFHTCCCQPKALASSVANSLPWSCVIPAPCVAPPVESRALNCCQGLMVSEGTMQRQGSNRKREPDSLTQWLGKSTRTLTFLFSFIFQRPVEV